MRRRAWIVGLAGLLVLGGCTATVAGDSAPTRSPAPQDAAPRSPGAPLTCPATRSEPAPDRPRVELEFTVADDRRSVTGIERVVFSPDRPTAELVFRLTANQPMSASGGSGIDVGDVSGEDVSGVAFEPAGADPDSQGGLLVVSLDRELAPGQSTAVTIEFALRLGDGDFDRFGVGPDVSWWGSGHPLLAWVPGRGWVRDRLLPNPGETAVSVVADTRVTVLAPPELTVAMTGGAQRRDDVGGLTRWQSREPVARDVAVAVGTLAEVRGPTDGVDVRVVAPDAEEAEELLTRAQEAIGRLAELFGPFPYATVSLVRLPDLGGGVEYPGLIMLADAGDLVLVHELAHMWFYGMVGDDQGRDPWLDEAFATYAELLVDGLPDDLAGRLGLPLDVGLPVADFPSVDDYFDTVYGKGSAMLVTARAPDSEAFDAAMRCYVETLAWQIATPADVAAALVDLPDALRVLTEAGALPG